MRVPSEKLTVNTLCLLSSIGVSLGEIKLNRYQIISSPILPLGNGQLYLTNSKYESLEQVYIKACKSGNLLKISVINGISYYLLDIGGSGHDEGAARKKRG